MERCWRIRYNASSDTQYGVVSYSSIIVADSFAFLMLPGTGVFLTETFSPEAVKKIRVTKKTKPMSKEKAEIIKGIKRAVKELNLIKAGKAEGIPARQLLDEL